MILNLTNISCFRQLGDSWNLTPNMLKLLEEFTCIIYGFPRVKELNEARAKMLQKMVGEDEALSMKSKVDFARLPPCQDSAIPHFQRVNHRVATFKRALEPIPELPKCYELEQGWIKEEDSIEPIWSMGPILPQTLIDVMISEDVDFEETDDSDIMMEIEENEDSDNEGI